MRPAVTLAVAVLLCGVPAASAGPPQLNLVRPPVVQRGAEATIQLWGADLGTEADLIVPAAAEIHREAVHGSQTSFRIRVREDVPLGIYPLRIRTRRERSIQSGPSRRWLPGE